MGLAAPKKPECVMFWVMAMPTSRIWGSLARVSFKRPGLDRASAAARSLHSRSGRWAMNMRPVPVVIRGCT